MLISHQCIVKYERSIFMTLKNITEKVKSVLSSGWHLWQELQHYFTLCYQMVRSFLDCLYQRFFKKNLTETQCLICKWTPFSCGIALVIILVCIILVI